MMDPVVYSEANAGMFEQKSQMPCMFMRNEFRVTPELTNSSVNISLPGVVPSLCDTARRTSTTCSYPGAASGQTSWGGPSWKASACYASPSYASPTRDLINRKKIKKEREQQHTHFLFFCDAVG